MAVSVDSVYQKVLALANKEQRGYITPLEFNLLANQAQESLFEQYFWDLDKLKKAGGDISDLSDLPELIKNKLAIFTTIGNVNGGTVYPINYRTGKVYAHGYEVRLVSLNEATDLLDSQFHRKSLVKNPVYIESNQGGQDIRVYDGSAGNGTMGSGVSAEIITRPIKVEWGYDVIAEKALYNASRSVDFELHESEEELLVLKTLEMAGIVLYKPGLTQIADIQENSTRANKKI